MQRPTPRHVQRAVVLAALLSLALACETIGGGKTVDASNEAVIAGVVQLDVSEASARGASDPAKIDAAIARIDTYVAENPDEPLITNALLVRKGHMLMAKGQRNGGLTTLNQVDPEQLSNERDLALYRLRDSFFWWYGVIGTAPGGGFQEKAEEHREEIQEVLNDLFPPDGERPAMFYYLHEWRVLIAVRMAQQTSVVARVREVLETGLTEYGASFDARDQEHIAMLCGGESENVDPQMVRWYETVRTALGEAQPLWQREAVGGGDPLPFPAWGDGCLPAS